MPLKCRIRSVHFLLVLSDRQLPQSQIILQEEKENEASTGWFGGWFNSKSKTKSVDKENVLDKLDPEEKTKLYEFIF